MPSYAQLNSDDIVHTVCHLSGEIVSPSVIEVPSLDESLIGKRYNRDTGEFEIPEQVDPPE